MRPTRAAADSSLPQKQGTTTSTAAAAGPEQKQEPDVGGGIPKPIGNWFLPGPATIAPEDATIAEIVAKAATVLRETHTKLNTIVYETLEPATARVYQHPATEFLSQLDAEKRGPLLACPERDGPEKDHYTNLLRCEEFARVVLHACCSCVRFASKEGQEKVTGASFTA